MGPLPTGMWFGVGGQRCVRGGGHRDRAEGPGLGCRVPGPWPARTAHGPTWNIALGLDARGEVSVFRDGVAVVVQRGELGRDLRVAGHQHRGQNCPEETEQRQVSVPARLAPRPSHPQRHGRPSLGKKRQARGEGKEVRQLQGLCAAAGTWGLHPLVVVGVHADLVLLHVKGELTQLHGPKLVVAVQVGPSP